MKKLKFDLTTALGVGATVLNVAGVLLSSIVHKNETNAMKTELKEELIKELLTEKK